MEQIVNPTVSALRLGKTILYPTDTIWGIGCDARNAEAVEKLYAIKERDHSKSMLVLVSDQWLKPNCQWITMSDRPTTYILPCELWEPILGNSVAPNLPAVDGSLGIRVPKHSFCQEVINRLGAPLVSTSANLSGYPSPTSYNDIEKALIERVDFCVPPLSMFDSHVINGSRIIKIALDGSQSVIRP